MRVQVEWTETIEKVATVEVDDLSEIDDSFLADVPDDQVTDYQVTDRVQGLATVLDEASVTIPAGITAPKYEDDWKD